LEVLEPDLALSCSLRTIQFKRALLMVNRSYCIDIHLKATLLSNLIFESGIRFDFNADNDFSLNMPKIS
jgi:hypothetical protein